MKLISPSVKEVFYEPTIDGMYKAIAESAYICYQTDPETAKLSPKEFTEKLIKLHHERPLEFGTVYLKIPWCGTSNETALVSLFRYNHWSKVKFFGKNSYDPCWLVTTNYRVVVENKLNEEMLKYWCYTEYHHKRYLAEFIASRGADFDFRTHIELSSIMESSRYCLYSNDKFNNELTYIDPYWKDDAQYEFVLNKYKQHERDYLEGASLGMQAQQLKRILDPGVKGTLRLCGFKDAWNNFFYRRCDSHADPECVILAKDLKSQFESNHTKQFDK